MKENVTLLQEINTLRSREHKIQLEIEGLERLINNIKKRGKGIIPDDGPDLTEEQHRQLEANQNIEMMSDEVTQMDEEIDMLLYTQKEIQAATNHFRQMEATKTQNEMQQQMPHPDQQMMQHRLAEEAMPETVEQPSARQSP